MQSTSISVALNGYPFIATCEHKSVMQQAHPHMIILVSQLGAVLIVSLPARLWSGSLVRRAQFRQLSNHCRTAYDQ